MKAWLPKEDLVKFLDSCREEYKVYGPAHDNGDVILRELAPDESPELQYSNFTLTPKSFFFPRCEVLCSYKGDELRDVPIPDEKILVFGMRPCDARGMVLLDKVFGEFGKGRDPYYAQRRENSVVIGLACSDPAESCFCTSVGGDPAGAEGSDILAACVKDGLLLESRTDKGQALMMRAGDLLSSPPADVEAEMERTAGEARKRIPVLALEGLKEKLDADFDSELWDRIAAVCLGCGLCTYQCPTCHCFDITDEGKSGEGQRIRTWDSCQYALFTMHASGHNPRPQKTQRMRQRILHKFLYTVDNIGDQFCVGCGRCVKHCPVNLDIREALTALREE